MTGRGRPHILFLAPAFPRLPSGGARTYYEHANGLVKRGYRVSVVHPLDTGRRPLDRVRTLARDRMRSLQTRGFRRVSWMEIDPRVELLTVDSFDERTQLPRADLRIGTFWRTSEYLAGEAAGDAPSMQLIQAYETWAGPRDRVDATWRLPMHLAVVSTALHRQGLALGVAEQRLHLVPNGLDHSIFRPMNAVPNRSPVVAFLAHESPVKGLHDAIEVCETVHRHRPDASILAFGVGRRPAALPKYADYLRAPSGSVLARRIYNEAAVFLCTSHSEGWGFPSVESMACGAALVSTRNGGTEDFAVDGESAVLCDVGDVPSLAESVLELLADTKLRATIARHGMERVAGLTWEASTEAFEGVVRLAIDEWAS